MARKQGTGKRGGRQRQPEKSKAKVTQTARQQQALNLRISGANYDQIAQAMGYRNRSGAYKAVEEALRKTIQEPADEVRKQELARLDRLLLSIWQQATTPGLGHLEALDRALKIQAQRLYYIVGLKVPDRPALTAQDAATALGELNYRVAITAIEARPDRDSEAPGQGESAGDGPALGQDRAGR